MHPYVNELAGKKLMELANHNLALSNEVLRLKSVSEVLQAVIREQASM
jgi:hypothetical protein